MPQAIVFAVAAAGVPGLVTTAGGLTALGSLASGALGLGISFGMSQLLAPKAPTPEVVKTVFRQSTPPRAKHRGRLRVGGPYIFLGSADRRVRMIVYLGQGPIGGILEHYLDDRLVDPLADPEGFIEEFYGGKAQVQFRLGTLDQSTFEPMKAKYPWWTDDFRARGCALAFIYNGKAKAKKINKLWPNRWTQYNGIIDGFEDVDPRTGLASSSRNLAVHAYGYLTDPDGAQIDPAYLDLDDFRQAADEADELLPTKEGGTVRRYHGQLSHKLDEPPGQVLGRLLTATCGRMYLKGEGKIGFKVGKWREPTLHITDQHVVAYTDFRDRSGPLKDTNEVVVRWTNPLARYSEATSEPWRDEDDISASGVVKNTVVDAFEIQHHHHARRVAKRKARLLGARWSGTIRTTLAGMQAWDQETIWLTLADLGIEHESFMVDGIRLADDDMSVELDLIAYDAEVMEMTAAEEGDPPVTPEELDEEETPTPQGLVVTAGQRRTSGGQTVATLQAAWDDPDDDGLDIEAQYSLADDEEWMPMQVAGDDRSAEVIGVTDGAAHDVRVRFVEPDGEVGNWAQVENVVAVADPTPPGAPTITATVSGSSVTVTLKAANDTHQATIELRRGHTYDSFEAATPLATFGVLRDLTVNAPDTPGPGAWRYFARARNASGVAQTPAPVTTDVVVS